MTNVYYAVVNSTSCIQKEQITFHIKSRFVDNFISENKVHVCKHFIYLFIYFILFYFIYHIFKIVKGVLFANCLKIGEVFFFSLRQDILIFDDVHSSACNIGHFLGHAFSDIFFSFLKYIKKELQICN